jgi:hypothetical protein
MIIKRKIFSVTIELKDEEVWGEERGVGSKV